ncbi:response regulator [Candidatus Aerophobetes bacterium]|nr:response regulator [Candidatus Aerophobetes bacterium]
MFRFLLVENEDSLRDFYTEELREEGYEIVSVANAQDALTKIKEENFHLAIVDIKMPGMDGLELLSRIVSEKRRIPVIINTAYPRYKDDFMSWAADAYVVKSSDLSELKDAVRKVLARYYGENEVEREKR